MSPAISSPQSVRKLAAVLKADVCNYSAHIVRDADRIVAALRSHRQIFSRLVERHEGYIVSTSGGDSVLAELPSIGAAVQCGVDVQTTFFKENSDVGEGQRIEWRMGISFGDVIVADGDLHGTAVNVAARIEQLVDPGAIGVSSGVYREVKLHLSLNFEYLGQFQLKNILDSIDIYQIRIPQTASTTSSQTKASFESLITGPRRSIMLIPFAPLARDEELQGFGIALQDEVLTSLTRFSEWSVFDWQPFLFNRTVFDLHKACRDLGVRYFLNGTVRRLSHTVRISSRLVDAVTSRILYATAYELRFEECEYGLSELAQRIVTTVVSYLQQAERKSTRHLSPEQYQAYDFLLQGEQVSAFFTSDSNAASRRFYEQAIALDQSLIEAHAALSRTYNYDWRYGWSRFPKDAMRQALKLAHKAVELNPLSAHAHAELGFVYLFMKEHDLALAEYEKALQINPNDTLTMIDYADALTFAGRITQARRYLEKATRLQPSGENDWILWSLADTYYAERDYQTVITTLKKMRNPAEGQRLLAAAYAQLGLPDEARQHAREVLKAHPDFSIARWREVVPEKDKEELEHLIEGLRKAGLK